MNRLTLILAAVLAATCCITAVSSRAFDFAFGSDESANEALSALYIPGISKWWDGEFIRAVFCGFKSRNHPDCLQEFNKEKGIFEYADDPSKLTNPLLRFIKSRYDVVPNLIRKLVPVFGGGRQNEVESSESDFTFRLGLGSGNVADWLRSV